MRRGVVLLAAALLMGCVSRPEPEPAVISQEGPPWEAPRDAISHIREAGLAELPLDSRDDPWVVDLRVRVDGEAVEVPAYIGVDRLRAVQAPVHTHDGSGTVWLEGEGNREVTLQQFFTLWGVRFADGCLGDACHRLEVRADGKVVDVPEGFVLRGTESLEVVAHRT